MLDAVSPFGVVRYSSLYNGNRRRNNKKLQDGKYDYHKELEERSGYLDTIPEETRVKEALKLEEEPTLEECSCPLSQQQICKEEEQFVKTQEKGYKWSQRTTEGRSVWTDRLELEEETLAAPQTRINLVSQAVDITRNTIYSISEDSYGNNERKEPLSPSTDWQGWLLLPKIKSLALDFLLCYIEGVTLRPETIQMIRRKYTNSNGKETFKKKKNN
ncbi:hypothetical protein Gasu2_67590 [Galdieria sulphuraria]|uniref:Uncharacterized protein n=1 Tax=Galdieria sulphuraria TaxID=130081 RepID=M2WYH2_GALSU|nr:uncharacterized protein Gasu_35000 [Galdieria sulphuraria]EME29110.1 hypothetical protein Gasu_35000 [Galdieria sulphuraria]GJD12686.1 hypothetical protein Gasu2_67590 [Galdieria sulphuraria]|eukprot:XP_005705630.1 hypothetical protein Gasu_35000 [Galdieria sulphuraria]